jgi:hypothetical protein
MPGITDTVSWILDLDVSKFMDNLSKAHGELKSIGQDNGLEGLVGTIEGVGQAFAAFEGVKIVGELTGAIANSALNASLLSEEVRTVQNEFRNLTAAAGLSSETLERGLKSVADGIVDDTDLMKVANQGVISLGQNAARLPQVFEIARQAASAFGGTALERMQQIQLAVESGNTRVLKQIGLWFDASQAITKYAHANGLQVEQLSEQGKQHAILNALLDQAAKKYQGIDVNQRELTNNMDRFKASMTELKEAASQALDKTIGPSIVKITELLGSAVKATADWIKEWFNIGDASQQVENLKKQIEYFESKKAMGLFTVADEQRLEQIKQQLGQIEQKKDQMAKADDARMKAAQSGGGGQSEVAVVDPQKKAEAQAKYYHELTQLQLQYQDARAKSATTMVEYDDAMNMKEIAMIGEQDAALAAKRDELSRNYLLSASQKHQILEMMERDHNQKLMQFETQRANEREKVEKDFAERQLERTNSIAAGWQKAALQSTLNVKNFQKLGEFAFKAVGDHAANAFMEMGAGSKSSAEIMRGFFFGALADIAENQGKLLLAQGLSGNAAAAAAGAGLLVLAGFLRSQASGSTSGSPSVDTGGGGGSVATTSTVASSDQSGVNMQTSTTPRKTVVVQVAGPIITDETKSRFIEILRQATDDTDFKYQQIGVG